MVQCVAVLIEHGKGCILGTHDLRWSVKCGSLQCVGDSSCICPVVVACNLQPPLSFKLCLGLIVHAFVSPVQSSFRSYLGLF